MDANLCIGPGVLAVAYMHSNDEYCLLAIIVFAPLGVKAAVLLNARSLKRLVANWVCRRDPRINAIAMPGSLCQFIQVY